MQENELRLGDLFVLVLRKWRSIVCFGIVMALILGIGAVALRLISLNVPAQLERMQAEYEVAYDQYWGAIEAIDRQIVNLEHQIEDADKKIERLEKDGEDYLVDIANLEADIARAGLRIQALEKKSANIEESREYRQELLNYRMEQNAKSLYMAIDPYDVHVSVGFVRVDANYQIIPGSTYQNINPTEELLRTYDLLITNAGFYEKMIKDLDLNTEVRYLTGVVSVEIYNTNSLRVRVVGTDHAWTEKIVDYICDAILAGHSTVEASVCEHTLSVYNKNSYAFVDMDIYVEQQANLDKEIELENSLREIDMSVLDIQSEIRLLHDDIRLYEYKIEDVEDAIAAIPVEKENLNGIIAEAQGTIHDLQVQKLELLREEPPAEPGMTLLGGLVRFIKFAVIGGIAAVVVAAVWFALVNVMRGKVLSAKQIYSNFGFSFFGSWSEEEGKKRPFACVDRWVNRVTGGGKGDEALVCANVAAAISGYSRILVCGGADVQRISVVASGLKKKCAGVEVIAAGSYVDDPKAVEGMACCDAVVLVEKIYCSNLDTIHQTKERAQTMDKPVLGVVLA